MAQTLSREVAVPDGMVLRHRAYRYRLDPTPRQERALLRHAGARRYAYNWAVEYLRDVRAIRAAELAAARAAGDQEAKPVTRWPSFIDLNNAFNAWKNGQRSRVPSWWAERHPDKSPPPWLPENPAHVYMWAIYEAHDGLADHMTALGKPWVTRRVRGPDGHPAKAKRPRIDFPRFKSRRRDRLRFKVTAGTSAARPTDRTHVQLPKLGRIHTREPMTRLLAAADSGAVLKTATVTRDGRGKWWISFGAQQLCAAARPTRRMTGNRAVGVDIGVKHLAALSTGHLVDNPRALGQVAAQLAATQRRITRARKGSGNHRRLARRVAALHARAAGIRRNTVHHATTTLARSFADVAVEDLNVAGMTAAGRGTLTAPGVNVRAKAGLNRVILDAGFAELRRQLTYKTSWYGSTLHVTGRFAPTSKICSACGWRDPNQTLADRTFTCTACGLVLDRDVNAARNIHRLAMGRPAPAQGGNPVRLRIPPPAIRRVGCRGANDRGTQHRHHAADRRRDSPYGDGGSGWESRTERSGHPRTRPPSGRGRRLSSSSGQAASGPAHVDGATTWAAGPATARLVRELLPR